MTDFENIKQGILSQIPELSDASFREGADGLWVEALLPTPFSVLMDYAYKELGFDNFHMTVGLDAGDHFEVVYVLTNAENALLNIKQRTVSREDTGVISVFQYFENSLFHERELLDLFGINVQGLPAGHRYPLPDKWPDGNYPLRKDWKPEFFDRQTLTYDSEAAAEAERKAIEEEQRKQAAKAAAIAAAKAKKAQEATKE